MEAVDLLRKFLLTGVLQNVLPESRVQIWFGCVVCFISFVLYHEASPYENAWCGYLQEMVLLQLLFSYISAFLFFNDGGDHYGADAYKWGFTLVIVNNLCAEHDLDRSASGSPCPALLPLTGGSSRAQASSLSSASWRTTPLTS